MNFCENASKQQKNIVYLYGALFGNKYNVFFIFVTFYWFDQKSFLNKFKFSSGFTLFKHV